MKTVLGILIKFNLMPRPVIPIRIGIVVRILYMKGIAKSIKKA
jgi:hypothetical protein